MVTPQVQAEAAETITRSAPSTDLETPGIWQDFQSLLNEDAHATAVIDDRGQCLSRLELHDLSQEIAQEMCEHGLKAGDTIIICMPNCLDWIAIYLAALRNNLVPGTLPITADPDSIAYVANLVGAQAIFLPGSYRSRNFEQELPDLTAAIGRQVNIMLSTAEQRKRTWRTFGGDPAPQRELPTGTVHILFSSSTTGNSKAIAHSESSLRAYNHAVINRYNVTDKQSIFMPSPLGHSTGFWHGARMSLMVGATLVLQDRWDPRRALELVEEHNAAITVAATPFLMDLVDVDWEAGKPKLHGMKAFLCGGAPIPPSLIQRAQDQMPDTQIYSIWAMSEGGATSSLPGDSVELVANTCGRLMDGTELEVLDTDGSLTPRGTEGEIIMKTKSLFLGYVNQPQLYEQSFTDEGYFRTGDTGIVDQHDYLQITGRLKDLIIRGGVNISPVEIEAALVGHPNISRVAVIGEPDERMGERICAAIEPMGTPPTITELQEWLASRNVSRRRWPEAIRIVSALPQTPAGKIRKNVLRENLFKNQ